MLFFIIFIIIPLIEIALFITIGDQIGVGYTLLLVLLTAIIGGTILRRQGIKIFFEAQTQLSDGAFPLKELFDGFCLVISGATLITPGFFTDCLGFLLLVPAFRETLRKNIPKIFNFELYGDFGSYEQKNKKNIDIIDVEFEEIQDKDDT
jgi:UPF0716 protein FxsA